MNVCIIVPKSFQWGDFVRMSLKQPFFFFLSCFAFVFLAFLIKEEKSRLLKERLDQIHFINERRCSQAPVYGRDLLRICSLPGRRKRPLCWSLDSNFGKGPKGVNYDMSLSKSEGDLILTLSQESLQDVLGRWVSVCGWVSLSLFSVPSLWCTSELFFLFNF